MIICYIRTSQNFIPAEIYNNNANIVSNLTPNLLFIRRLKGKQKKIFFSR